MLEVSQFSVRYGQHQTLDNVSLHVARGEMVVILGTNGAGKSTMLKAIGGMVNALPGGRAILEGVDLLQLPSHRLVEQGLALVPEGRGIFADLSVRDNLMLGALTKHA